MVDLAVDEEAHVRARGDVGVDHRVLGAVDVHPEPSGGERVAVRDRRDPVAELAEHLGHRGRRPQPQARPRRQRGAHAVGDHVVEVLVGDEHRVRSVQGMVTAERPGVDD